MMLAPTMKSRMTVLAVLAAFAVAPVATRAQDAAARIGVCNPARVFQNMDERKAVEDRLRSQREGIRNEAQKMQLEIQEIERQLRELKPDSLQAQEKQNQLMDKAVRFEVFAKVKDAEMQRVEKEQIKVLFDKIADACKTVATQRKLDLVLAERRPEIPGDMRQMNADQLRALLSQRDVLFIDSAKADITDAVTAELNRQFAAPPAQPAPGGTQPPPVR